MTDYTKLVEALRERAGRENEWYEHGGDIIKAAADAIEALQTDWIYEHATYHSDLNKALEEDIFIDGTDGFIVDGDVGYARHSFNYWMPIEPPKEDA